jgi:tetratricopeptide (TPR) repeat protein
VPGWEAESHFQKGLLALRGGRPLDAVEQFEAAVVSSRSREAGRLPMQYLSYYGLSMAVAHRPSEYAIRACEKAAGLEPSDPALQYNLGEVYLLAGRKTKALAAFERGLRLNPASRCLRAKLARLDRRSRPAIPKLGRDHPVNRWVGRARAAIARVRGAGQ